MSISASFRRSPSRGLTKRANAWPARSAASLASARSRRGLSRIWRGGRTQPASRRRLRRLEILAHWRANAMFDFCARPYKALRMTPEETETGASHKIARHARLLQLIDIAGTFVLAVQGASIGAL